MVAVSGEMLSGVLEQNQSIQQLRPSYSSVGFVRRESLIFCYHRRESKKSKQMSIRERQLEGAAQAGPHALLSPACDLLMPRTSLSRRPYLKVSTWLWIPPLPDLIPAPADNDDDPLMGSHKCEGHWTHHHFIQPRRGNLYWFKWLLSLVEVKLTMPAKTQC